MKIIGPSKQFKKIIGSKHFVYLFWCLVSDHWPVQHYQTLEILIQKKVSMKMGINNDDQK